MAKEPRQESKDFEPAEKQSADPRLRLFLRQAGAIIAAERGLSESCRRRLQTLAVRLELTHQQFHQAIETLQGTAKFSEPLNHWERSFVEFLKREFNPFRGRVLTISIENRALDLAARKYQIQEVRAHELIQSTAEQLGIGRIAEADAVWFGNRLIVDTLGSQREVEPTQLRELYRIGDQWGLDRDAVDQRVQQTVADNRRSSRRSPYWRWSVIGAIVSLTTLSVLMWVWQLGWFGMNHATNIVAVVAPDIAGEPRSDKVAWWNESLEQASAEIEGSQFLNLQGSVRSTDSELRLSGLRRLLDLANAEPRNADSIHHLVAGIYFSDPQPDVEGCVLRSLEGSLEPLFQPGLVTDRQAAEGFGAIRLLTAVLYASVETEEPFAPSRLEAAQQLAFRFLGPLSEELDRPAFVSGANRKLALDLWGQLVQMSFTSTSQSAALIDRLSAMTRPMLEPEIFFQVRSAAVLTVLENDMNQWRTLQKTVSELIGSSNQSQAIEWVDRLTEIKNQAAADFIADELVKRLDVSVDGDALIEKIERLMEVRSAYLLRRFPIVQTNLQIDQLALPLSDLLIEETQVSPELIAKLMYLSNLSLAYIAELETSQNHPMLNELLAEGVPEWHFPEDQIEDPLVKSPTPSEIRDKNRAFERLKISLGTNRLAVRTSSFSALAGMAPRFRDFTYEEAGVLADYVLASSELKEWLLIEGLLPNFSNLPNVHLAIADRAEKFVGQSDRLLTLHRLLTDQDCKIDRPEQWRQCVKNSLVLYALGVLQSRVTLAANTEQGDDGNVVRGWQQLGRYQENALPSRVAILDRWAGNGAGASDRYSEALAGLYGSANDRSGRVRSLRGSALAANGPPIVQAVVANQLLVEFLTGKLRERGPVSTEQVNSLLADYGAAMKRNASNDRRLLTTEFFLWKFASLLRRQKTSELQEKERG